MVFREKSLSQVYNLCLHSVWSLHPSYVCKVMTLSAHTLSIKLNPAHSRTSTVCNYVVISGYMQHQTNDYTYGFLLISHLKRSVSCHSASPVGRCTIVPDCPFLERVKSHKRHFYQLLSLFCLGGYSKNLFVREMSPFLMMCNH